MLHWLLRNGEAREQWEYEHEHVGFEIRPFRWDGGSIYFISLWSVGDSSHSPAADSARALFDQDLLLSFLSTLMSSSSSFPAKSFPPPPPPPPPPTMPDRQQWVFRRSPPPPCSCSSRLKRGVKASEWPPKKKEERPHMCAPKESKVQNAEKRTGWFRTDERDEFYMLRNGWPYHI